MEVVPRIKQKGKNKKLIKIGAHTRRTKNIPTFDLCLVAEVLVKRQIVKRQIVKRYLEGCLKSVVRLSDDLVFTTHGCIWRQFNHDICMKGTQYPTPALILSISCFHSQNHHQVSERDRSHCHCACVRKLLWPFDATEWRLG